LFHYSKFIKLARLAEGKDLDDIKILTNFAQKRIEVC
jgi:hypothetical protein